MSKTPSAILSDALTSFNKAATLAFTTAQDQAHKDVAQATAEAREARRERDEAVDALHTHRLEEQAWKQEASEWKAAANQADLAIQHHLESIAQLRQEANQWKNQCLRLEETSRQEAISWKEQFLRVEQERSKLAQRVEELVTERLASSGHTQASILPYTPLPRYSVVGDLSASARLQRASALDTLSPSLQERPLTKPSSKMVSGASRARPGHALQLPTPLSESQRSARSRVVQDTAPSVSQQGSTPNGTRQVVVRRVHAVVEVPVKEESLDRDMDADTATTTAATNPASTSSSAPESVATSQPSNAPMVTELINTAPRAKRKASAKRSYVEIDDEESGRDDGSKRSDIEDYQLVSDGDDELLMGTETNRKEVYGMKRVPKINSLQKSARPLTVAKKRKAPAGTGTKKNRPSAPFKP